MDEYGYILKGNAATASPDYIPSLIGVEEGQLPANRRDPYFERVELKSLVVTSLGLSRWVAFDSLPLPVRDPILEVRSPGQNYYIPKSELEAIAARHQEDAIFEMIATLFRGRRP